MFYPYMKEVCVFPIMTDYIFQVYNTFQMRRKMR